MTEPAPSRPTRDDDYTPEAMDRDQDEPDGTEPPADEESPHVRLEG